MSLVVVGSVAFDAIETPLGSTNGKIIGGAATFISLVSSYFCPRVNLVAVVGGDFPKETISLFKAKGINTEGLQIKENEKSFFWAGKYHDDLNSRDTLVTELNVLGTFDPVIPESYQDCEYLMLGNLSPDVQMTVLKRLRKRPKLVVMDTMNFWMRPEVLPELKAVLAQVDVLSINDEEARILSGEHSLVKAAKVIKKMGPKTLIIKKGEHGALLFGPQDELFYAPALPLEEVYDPTGAGDCFAAGFIAHMASKNSTSLEDMKRGVIKGSAMASFCVEKFGTERIINLTADEIAAREQLFADLVKI
ncbi:MAG: sugar kinase [Cytophagales bacterium]|nr:MAG: sugar kinase [Cytophagales bacterium]TAF62514.1 MAG: sugar kinase [Cytophagales bacterium]